MKHGLRLRFWLATVAVIALLSLSLPAYAASPVIPPAIKQIIGLYEGDGDRFLLRENDGRVELLYARGDKMFLGFRSGIPEHFRNRPRPVCIVNDEAVPVQSKFFMNAHQRLGRRTPQKSPRPVIEGGADKVVVGRIANIELDSSI